MKPKQRIRTVGSVSNELLKKSREAALAAVQVFNNPAITFKSEIFVVMMVISWTYLLHAHFRKQGIEYRYFKQAGTRKRFDKTSKSAFKYWDLERCLNDKASPVDKAAANNLRFLVGLRHEIEHQMTNRLDEHLSARFQACCLNYNHLIKRLFGDDFGIDKHLSFSLQFSAINTDQWEVLHDAEGLPPNIRAFINAFDSALTEAEFNDPRFAYRVLFVPKTVNRKGQADKVIEFIKADSELAKDVNKHYAVVKETEKAKYLPKQVVEMMQASGYPRFTMHSHTQLWKRLDAKNPVKGLGVMVVNSWYWYQPWLDTVASHCKSNAVEYA
jgi:hypothetical protein